SALKWREPRRQEDRPLTGAALVDAVLAHKAMKHDLSPPLASQRVLDEKMAEADCEGLACGTSPGATPDDPAAGQERPPEPIPPLIPPPTLSATGIAVEQTSQGSRPAAPVLESFDGLGAGFVGPQGTTNFRN